MKVRLDGGETATASSFESGTLTLHSPKAFAPGSPIRFEAVDVEPPRAFEGRTIGSKRIDGAFFEVRLRLVNLRKAAREFLVEQL